MFVRLLVLLITNVLCYFSVLWYCRSLHSMHGYKGRNGLKEKFRVPASALERTWCDRAHYDRTQGTRLTTLHVDPHLARLP
jgi:hypothetical protein